MHAQAHPCAPCAQAHITCFLISFPMKSQVVLHISHRHTCGPSEHIPILCETDAPVVPTGNTTFPYGFSMISMWRTWCAVRVPRTCAVVRSPAGRPWAGTIPWNCSFSQGFIRVSEKLSDFDDNYQVSPFGGHAETQGFPMVFGGSQEAACRHVCSAWAT